MVLAGASGDQLLRLLLGQGHPEQGAQGHLVGFGISPSMEPAQPLQTATKKKGGICMLERDFLYCSLCVFLLEGDLEKKCRALGMKCHVNIRGA